MGEKNLSLILILLLLTLFLVNFYFLKNFGEENSKVCFDDICFDVELVVSEKERETGLMFRKSLGKMEGMLFIFPYNDYHRFWMKNTLIPLDIIWISYDLKVVHIEKNVPICINDSCEIYFPHEKSLYVLEINAGKSEEFRINVGDKTSFS